VVEALLVEVVLVVLPVTRVLVDGVIDKAVVGVDDSGKKEVQVR
jgi:hypothetical protein